MRSTIKVEDSLTILMPLKGRDSFTKKILKHSTQLGIPFKILVADGGNVDNSSWINKDYYPSLNIEYHYFGVDSSIHRFMVKMNKACSLITSPLTIMVDNDDFVSLEGLKRGINFLSKNDDYISFRQNVCSVNHRKSNNALYRAPSITGVDPFDRMIEGLSGKNSCWVDTIRTHALQRFFEVMDKSNTQDLQLILRMNTCWHLIYGKSYRGISKPYYFHVSGHSLVQNKGIYSKYKDWPKNGEFNKSIAISLSLVGKYFEIVENQDLDTVKEKFCKLFLKDIFDYGTTPLSKIPELTPTIIKMSEEYDSISEESITKVLPNNKFTLSEEITIIERSFDEELKNIK